MAAAAAEERRPYDVGRTAVYREQLGEDSRSAQYKLTRVVLLGLARKLGLAACHRCGGEIGEGESFHLDHVVEWIDAPNARELFWDVDNVRFSHPSCNRRQQRRYATRKGPGGTMRCTACGEFKQPEEFPLVRRGRSRSPECAPCRRKRVRDYRAARKAAQDG